MALVSTRNRVALLKMETTYGVDPVPTFANPVLLMNSNIAPMADKLTRQLDHSWYGNDPFVLVGKRVELTAEMDLLGALAPATASPWGPILRTCGLSETLAPSALAAPTCTAAGSATGGTLPAASYFWKVTGYNANGDTVGSTEVTYVATGATSSALITITVPTAGAIGYRVWRGTVTNTEVFLADIGNTLTFTDTGAFAPVAGYAIPVADATKGTSYQPISASFESSSVYFYEGGILFKMSGVRGYFDWDIVIKTYAKAKVKLTGILSVIPADGAFPTGINWNVFGTPTPINTESWLVQANGININTISCSVTCGAEIAIHEGSETREVYYADRKPAGTLRVMKDLALATWNPWAIAESLQIISLTNRIIGVSGASLNNPMRIQLEYPKPVDENGILAYDIPFNCVPSTGGNDEFAFGFA